MVVTICYIYIYLSTHTYVLYSIYIHIHTIWDAPVDCSDCFLWWVEITKWAKTAQSCPVWGMLSLRLGTSADGVHTLSQKNKLNIWNTTCLSVWNIFQSQLEVKKGRNLALYIIVASFPCKIACWLLLSLLFVDDAATASALRSCCRVAGL